MGENKLASSEIEQSIIGCVLLDNDNSLETIKDLNLKDSDFYYDDTRFLFNSIMVLAARGEKIDTITLVEFLKNENMLEAIGGCQKIVGTTTIVIDTNNLRYYIGKLKELSNKRKILEEIDDMAINMEKLTLSDLEKRITSMNDIASDTNRFDSMFTSASDIKEVTKVKSLSTGFNKLDRALHGLEYGTLTVLAGKPATGKSTILNQIIANALFYKVPVFLYSGELPQKKVMAWFKMTVANSEDIKEYTDEYGATRYGLDVEASRLIQEWSKDLYIFNDNEKSSETNLINTIKYLHKEKGVKLVVLDNLMTMIADNPTNDKYEMQEHLVTRLKNLAKAYELVIILVAHEKKKDNNKNNTTDMFDIFGSSAIPGLADYVLHSQRNIVRSKETGEIIADTSGIFITKNRSEGLQGVGMDTVFDKTRKRFYTEGAEELKRDYCYRSKYEQMEAKDIPF
ncbi:MAG: DnaB-like helicase C-terminal domain-containing protein [Candidatus Onthovivens sp.]|nr:DnaB-like helicase C-terminal domain-containing protein [Candidatus Onthovivens sp.]